MDFIVNNYLWFVIGGIVLLMIIIGFIAEQTDFGKKPLGEKKEEPKPEGSDSTDSVQLTAEPIKEEGINSLLENSLESSNDELSEDVVEPITDTNDTTELEVPAQSEDLPEVNVEEDLNVPFGDQTLEKPVVEETNPSEEEIAPGVEEVSEIKDSSGVPETSEETDEEDVWKF